MYYTNYESPVGKLLLVATTQGLSEILFEHNHQHISEKVIEKKPSLFDNVIKQLDEYFAGARKQFDLALHIAGTAFQQKVYHALMAIPYGETRSYGDIATAIDAPQAQRAVGNANRRNPLPIVVPCHRVIGKNGKLVGFNGGIAIKEKLLSLEKP